MAAMSPSERYAGAFGPNAWLVDDMYEKYRQNPDSVSKSWQEFFADRELNIGELRPLSGSVEALRAAQRSGQATKEARQPEPNKPKGEARHLPPSPTDHGGLRQSEGGWVKGAELLPPAGRRLVSNMEASLAVPTATSVRPMPAKLLEVNRSVINNHLARTRGGKVSYTHLLAYAVVRALAEVPALNASFVPNADGLGHPGVIRHAQVGLGLAVDLERSDGTRALVVPCIQEADTLDFRTFVLAYEDLVRRARTNKLLPDDFAGVTVTLTNPGTLGTVQSVPRLMENQGAIVAVGAIDWPVEYQAADPARLADMGVSKVVTVSSTYDHRVIQGAESGQFLAKLYEAITGSDGFFDRVFASLQIPYVPYRWSQDTNPVDDRRTALLKQSHLQALVNMYRVRGHLIADLDPLGLRPPHMYQDLDPSRYGFTIWDLDRQFLTDGLAGHDSLRLAEVIAVLRDAYCRTVGVEYMHIQDSVQKQWIQRQVEGVPIDASKDEQARILERLNAAEAFERFLHSRYIGQKRFGLEGAESAIVVLGAMLDEAADSGIEEAVLGMAHRGRLNVLANIVGMSYGDIFKEFEGDLDPDSVQGSGDVKYHKGADGEFVSAWGRRLRVTLASNPSHLEAVDPVVQGMTRARQDRHGAVGTYPVLSVLVHGDAAFAGQGVVAETLNLSALRGYRTGGTVHLVINNQLGFTTAPEAARSSVYPTDVAKMVQAPIFHVNGDDPEACARVARLALRFRETFHKDVVIDMFCYRRFGHNETDEPSYTQPQMYKRIERKRSVRKLYTEALIARGDLTLEEAERALEDFSAKLSNALEQTRSSASPPKELPPPPPPAAERDAPETGVDRSRLDVLAAHLHGAPEGFSVHPKLRRYFQHRAEAWKKGEVDWALAEALAFASLLSEGVDVRVAGQDTRRGTFSHRHAVLVDYETGEEWVPLSQLGRAGLVGIAEPSPESGNGSGEPSAGPVRDSLPSAPSPATGESPPGGKFWIYDSSLSEYGAVGFEYGYSVERPDALVAWEAQFGDFANGAQITIDEFVVSAGDKWGQSSGLVMLLPHGGEGQGPDHSSARMERFLQLAAGENIAVAVPTTAAQYFHLLRSQIRRKLKRPLVILTPKSLLRARVAQSHVENISSGRFHCVLDDYNAKPKEVSRVLLCTGKVAYDAMSRRDQLAKEGSSLAGTAVVRVEQLYPWPEREIAEVLGGYPHLEEVVWLQEEPENMGAWSYARSRLHRIAGNAYPVWHVSRAPSGSPASGSAALHLLEAEDLLRRAFARD